MNGTDLFCSTVTQMINPGRLAAFASAVVSDGPIVAAPIITEARHDHVLTPRYELIPTIDGVTGRTASGEMTMSWVSIATLLAAATTPERARALSDAVTVGGSQPPHDGPSLDALRADYAHAAATLAGLIDPPTHRQVDNGYDIELRSTSHRTTASINGVELFDLRPNQFHTAIDVRTHTDPTTGHSIDGFKASVLFVPPGDSNAPIAGSVGRRVGIDRIGPDSDVGAQLAVQIDGYDSVIVEAFPERGVRVAVYDHDPDHDFLRFEKTFPIAALPSAAELRLGALKVEPSGRER